MGDKMSENLKKFREFVDIHPLLKESVKNKERSWQEYYEDFIILGPYDESWKKYEPESNFEVNESKNGTEKIDKAPKKDIASSTEFLKTAYNYIKKMDTDKVTKGLSNAQKVIGIFQGFIGGGAGGVASGLKKTGDPLFDKKFDDWY